MKKVCLMVGHWNIENITSQGLRSWRSASVLKTSTGASGERDYHWNEVMPKLRDKLIQAGVQVYIVGATYQPEAYNREYDLWVSLHYDGGGEGERCMISAPNRETQPAYLHDEAQREAERFCALWKEIYPKIVGVPNRDDLITAGMKDYYAFDYVGFDTPSVIIEHFNHTSPRGKELKTQAELVANADFQAISKFLGLEEETIPDAEEEKKNGEITGYERFVGDLADDLGMAMEKHDFAKLSGRVIELVTKEKNYEKFVENVAKGIGCAEETEKAVREALVDLQAHISAIKKRKLGEFGAWERIISGIIDLIPKRG